MCGWVSVSGSVCVCRWVSVSGCVWVGVGVVCVSVCVSCQGSGKNVFEISRDIRVLTDRSALIGCSAITAVASVF